MEIEMNKVYEWLNSIMEKYPPFDSTNHIPLSVRHPNKSVKELWKMIGDKDENQLST